MFVKTQTRQSHRPTGLEGQKLGMRSPFVLAKIGNDLRQEYDYLLEDPLPEELQQVTAQLPDAPKVLPFPKNPKAEI